MHHIKHHYSVSHRTTNPTGVVPMCRHWICELPTGTRNLADRDQNFLES